MTDKIIIANDDILVEEFETLINEAEKHLKPGMVLGAHSSCFNVINDNEIVSIEKVKDKRTKGWGVLLFIFKDSYKEIPGELKIWAGDNIQFFNNSPYYFKGIYIETEMSTTVGKDKFLEIARCDSSIYKTYYTKFGDLKCN